MDPSGKFVYIHSSNCHEGWDAQSRYHQASLGQRRYPLYALLHSPNGRVITIVGRGGHFIHDAPTCMQDQGFRTWEQLTSPVLPTLIRESYNHMYIGPY